MIQMQTRLDVADNTGAKEVMCIKVLGGTHRRTAGLGDIVVCSVKSVIAGSDVKKKSVVRGVIVRCRQPTRREDGSYVRFDNNAIVIDRQRQEPARHAHLRGRGPRAAGPQFHEDREPRQRGSVMHIRVDDTVEVITGDDRGTRGKVLKVMRADEQARGRGRQPRLSARSPQPAQPAGRPTVEGDADLAFERAAGLQCVRQAHADRRPAAGRRRQGALLQEVRCRDRSHRAATRRQSEAVSRTGRRNQLRQ